MIRRRSFDDSELLPLATRGADPGGKRCTKCITLSLTSVSKIGMHEKSNWSGLIVVEFILQSNQIADFSFDDNWTKWSYCSLLVDCHRSWHVHNIWAFADRLQYLFSQGCVLWAVEPKSISNLKIHIVCILYYWWIIFICLRCMNNKMAMLTSSSTLNSWSWESNVFTRKFITILTIGCYTYCSLKMINWYIRACLFSKTETHSLIVWGKY